MDYIDKCQKFRCPSCKKNDVSFYFMTTQTLISCRNPNCKMALGRDYWGFRTTHSSDPQFLVKIETGQFVIKSESVKKPDSSPKFFEKSANLDQFMK